jgi:lysophospholipase L1-like esterase
LPRHRLTKLLAWLALPSFLGVASGLRPAHADPSTAVHVVVLGSSTAEGVGPSSPDSAWVNRYRAALLEIDDDHQVTNLAHGGYTTWHIRPTGAAHPGDRPAPDPARNVTQALSLGPDAIIVNLPSNDVAFGYPIVEQIANYDLVRSVAAAAGVPVWFTTSQPRNLSAAFRDSLKAMRDTTFALYDRYAVDFWTDLAAPDGTILPLYNSGDGIHLNDAAHRILFQRALAEDIHRIYFVGVEDRPYARARPIALSVRPHPARTIVSAHFTLDRDAEVAVALYDLRGRRVAWLDAGPRPAGPHVVTLDVSGLPSGLYFCALRDGAGRTAVTRLTVLR